MFLSFSKTLKKMSGFRVGAHFRLKGWSLLVFGIFILMFYMVYWSFLAALWMIYGVCYLYYLIFKGIASLFKRKNKTAPNGTDKPEPIKNPVYYATGGTSYHKKRSCVGSETVHVVSLSTAENVLGLHPCGRCCKK